MWANRIFHHRVFININYISENMSRVEHILILIQQAGVDHEKLWETKEKLQEIIQDPSLDQQDREALKEIESDIEERLVEAWEVGFENQLFAEADAQVYNYVGLGGHGANAEHGGNDEYGGHGEYGGNSGSNDYRGGA